MVGEKLGTSYTAQAVSDWERDKSQIHKDHPQVLKALIQVLYTCGGLTSPKDAERLLAAGNYRGLSHAESESIFLMGKPDPAGPSKIQWLERLLRSQTQEKTTLPDMLVLKITSIILCWLAAWLAISPTLDFSNSDQSLLLKQAIILGLTGLVVPTVLAWITSINSVPPISIPVRFVNFIGGVLGFSLGLVNIMTLAILAYNLYLYPWPTALILIISLWPVGLGLISAELIQAHFHPVRGEIRLRDIQFRWAILSLPLLIGLGLYHFHQLLSARLLGPLLLMVLSLGLGLLLWSHTRTMS